MDDFRLLVALHLGLGEEKVGSTMRLTEDLGLDSLGMHALLLELVEYGYAVPTPDSLRNVVTVADLQAVVVAETVHG